MELFDYVGSIDFNPLRHEDGDHHIQSHVMDILLISTHSATRTETVGEVIKSEYIYISTHSATRTET